MGGRGKGLLVRDFLFHPRTGILDRLFERLHFYVEPSTCFHGQDKHPARGHTSVDQWQCILRTIVQLISRQSDRMLSFNVTSPPSGWPST